MLLFVVGLAGVLAAFKVIPFYVVLAVLCLWQLPLLWLGLKKSRGQRSVKLVLGVYFLLNLYFFARGVSLFSYAAWDHPSAFRSGATAAV